MFKGDGKNYLARAGKTKTKRWIIKKYLESEAMFYGGADTVMHALVTGVYGIARLF